MLIGFKKTARFAEIVHGTSGARSRRVEVVVVLGLTSGQWFAKDASMSGMLTMRLPLGGVRSKTPVLARVVDALAVVLNAMIPRHKEPPN
jgi:hypothetical protein